MRNKYRSWKTWIEDVTGETEAYSRFRERMNTAGVGSVARLLPHCI
jgi:hypothetical protein